MKTMNKMMAIMAIMSLTATMPAMAANNMSNGMAAAQVSAPNSRHHDESMDLHSPNHHHADVRVYTFNLPDKAPGSHHTVSGRHRAPSDRTTNARYVVASVERVSGVINASFNPRTGLVTVHYDAHRTNPQAIRRAAL